MFVETPDDSKCDADLFDFCEFHHPDPRGISETPAEFAIDGRQSWQAWSSVRLNRFFVETATREDTY
jgi:hypothetical protein